MRGASGQADGLSWIAETRVAPELHALSWRVPYSLTKKETEIDAHTSQHSGR